MSHLLVPRVLLAAAPPRHATGERPAAPGGQVAVGLRRLAAAPTEIIATADGRAGDTGPLLRHPASAGSRQS